MHPWHTFSDGHCIEDGLRLSENGIQFFQFAIRRLGKEVVDDWNECCVEDRVYYAAGQRLAIGSGGKISPRRTGTDSQYR